MSKIILYCGALIAVILFITDVDSARSGTAEDCEEACPYVWNPICVVDHIYGNECEKKVAECLRGLTEPLPEIPCPAEDSDLDLEAR